MGDSPVVIIYGSNGAGGFEEKGTTNPFTVEGYGVAGTPAGGVLSVQGVGSGTLLRTSMDGYSIGQLPVRGAGTAGNPSNGVLTVQGATGGTALNVNFSRPSTSSVTNVSAAVATTTLLVANVSRAGAAIYNDTTATCYLKLGASATTTSFTIALGRYEYYEVPFGYTGIITGYWTAATGTARVTELT